MSVPEPPAEYQALISKMAVCTSLAMTLRRRSDLPGAAKQLEKALRVCRGCERKHPVVALEASRVWLNLGAVLSQSGRRTEALHAIEEAEAGTSSVLIWAEACSPDDPGAVAVAEEARKLCYAVDCARPIVEATRATKPLSGTAGRDGRSRSSTSGGAGSQGAAGGGEGGGHTNHRGRTPPTEVKVTQVKVPVKVDRHDVFSDFIRETDRGPNPRKVVRVGLDDDLRLRFAVDHLKALTKSRSSFSDIDPAQEWKYTAIGHKMVMRDLMKRNASRSAPQLLSAAKSSGDVSVEVFQVKKLKDLFAKPGANRGRRTLASDGTHNLHY